MFYKANQTSVSISYYTVKSKIIRISVSVGLILSSEPRYNATDLFNWDKFGLNQPKMPDITPDI